MNTFWSRIIDAVLVLSLVYICLNLNGCMTVKGALIDSAALLQKMNESVVVSE